MTVSKGMKLMAYRNLCGQCEYLLFVIRHADFPRLYDCVILTSKLVSNIYIYIYIYTRVCKLQNVIS